MSERIAWWFREGRVTEDGTVIERYPRGISRVTEDGPRLVSVRLNDDHTVSVGIGADGRFEATYA